jgi:hypothetical protein
MGGFFIRRKLNDSTPQNELYKAVMNEVCILSLAHTLHLASAYDGHHGKFDE